MKKCIKCGEEKNLSEFYKHSAMKDGHLNKCKECVKKYASEHYFKNIDHYRQYERSRLDDPVRKKLRNEYSAKLRKENPEKIKEYHRCYDAEKRKAENKVNNALRDGRIKKEPCSICGNIKSEAHHEDYTKPLDVIWLCRTCHCLRHREINDLNKVSA